MDGPGKYNVKESDPDSERRKSHARPHLCILVYVRIQYNIQKGDQERGRWGDEEGQNARKRMAQKSMQC